MQIDVYRNRSVIERFKIDEKARLTQRFFGENQITIDLTSNRVLNIAVGDYIVYAAIRYYVNTLPVITKEATNLFKYALVFESEYYDLSKVQFMLNGSSDFDYIGDVEKFIDLLIINLNRVYGAAVWSKGTFTQTNEEFRLLHFQEENCRNILQRLCTEFEGEVSFNKKVISFGDSVGSTQNLTLQYKQGLRNFTRSNMSDKNLITRLYVFGAAKNLPHTYGSSRLKPIPLRNLLTNPGFELNSLSGWTTQPAYDPLIHEVQSSIKYAGSYAIKLTGTGQHVWVQQTVSAKLPVSGTFTLSAMIRIHPAFPVSGRVGIIIQIHYTDASYDSIIKDAVLVGGSWQKISASLASDPDKTIDHLIIFAPWTNSLTGIIHGDNIQLEYGAEVNDFIDGQVYCLEKNINKYGVIESTKFFDEIYPRRTGEVSAASEDSEFVFTDAAIDFNVNTYLLPGMTAKVHFQTGQLAGYSFEIASFNNATKAFTILPVDMQNGTKWPNLIIRPAIGDKYVLLDIDMPTSYVFAAEKELLARGSKYLDDNCEPKVSYDLTTDSRYFRTNGILLNIGDKLTIVDSDLGINKIVRVIELSRSLIDQYNCSVKLSDIVEAPMLMQQYGQLGLMKIAAAANNLSDVARARRNWKDSTELQNMVFDPDGYFTDSIRPNSIETRHLIVAAKSTNFVLSGVLIKPNYTGDKSKVSITAGSLIHFSIDSSIKTWTLQAASYTGLVDATAYYIYAKCHKTDYVNVNNKILLDTNQITVDEDATYYYFLVGILHPVVGTVRGISLTYGQTLINGGFITTGKISSANGSSYFDLDGNKMVIGSGSTIAGTNITSIQNGATNGATWGVNIGSQPNLGAMAYENAVELAKLGSTVVVGGYIKTELLTANNITAGTFTGLTFRTAASGTRLIIDSSDNTLRLFVGSESTARIILSDNDGPFGASVVSCQGYVISTADGTWDHSAALAGETVMINGVEVVKAQGAAVADAAETTVSVKTQLNLLLARMRAHGLIAT